MRLGDAASSTSTDSIFQSIFGTTSPSPTGTTDTSGTASSLPDASSISNIISTIGTGLTTLQLEQINLTRAQQGLPPISAQSVAPQVNVGLSTPTLLLIGGGILAVVILGASRRKH